MTRLSLLLGLAFAATPALAANTKARLILSHETAKVGETITAGIHLAMKPGWHTYWRNGGDSGAPTTIEWTLPPDVSAGPIRWPKVQTWRQASPASARGSRA